MYSRLKTNAHDCSMAFTCGPLKYCYPLGSLAPNRSWLEVFEKVEHVLLSQETPKLQTVKLFWFFKNYIFLFIYHIVIWKQRHLWTLLIFSSAKILTACNFVASWGTRTCLTFLETSNQYEFGARLTGALQHFEPLSGHA